MLPQVLITVHISNIDNVNMKVIVAVLIDKSMSNRSVRFCLVSRSSSTQLTSQQSAYLGSGGLSINITRPSRFISGNGPSDKAPMAMCCCAIALRYPQMV